MTAGRVSAESTVVQVRRMIPAAREEVFRAWTDPDLVRQWFKPRGGSSPSVEMDVRVGGRYRWGMKLLGRSYFACGEYIEVAPPERLVFTFGWERVLLVHLTDSLVTVEFLDHGDRTEVVITHERLPSRTLRTMRRAGWQSCLVNLGRLVTGK